MKKALKIKKDPFSAEDVGIFYGSYDSYEDYLKAGGEPYNRQTLEAINDTDEENFSGPYDSFDEFLEELYGKM